ncbi:RNA recognition motif domain-containing protein [Hirschfeldia incana]|nr:RNA recognition motif domain-containing protein [Hirschfeldia incana]
MDEEDDDYDDLYNEVNVGEGFVQSARKSDEVEESRNEEIEKVKTEGEISIPGESVAIKEGSGSGVVVASSGAEDTKVSDVSQQIPGGGGLIVELGQAPAPEAQGNANGVTPPRRGGNMVGNGATIHGGGSGITTLFIGDLHWWTTDAHLEAELCKYGVVKEVRFFDEKANGKSRGYCQAEFYDSQAAAACKEGMDGYEFNGNPCLVEIAPPYVVKRLGDAQLNRSHQSQSPSKPVRAAESSYGEEALLNHQYGEVTHERGGRPNYVKDKERGSERGWSSSSHRRHREEEKDAGYERDIPREKDVGHHGYDLPETRHRDDRDTDREREMEREKVRHREERERYGGDHRYRHRDEPEHDDEWNRGRSSRGHSKSRL